MNFTLRAWLDASRPKTLPLAWMAILVGSLLAFHHGRLSWVVLGLSLLTATLLQVLSNLANDYGDGMRGVDNAARLGPVRAMQSGTISAQQLRRSLLLVSALCMASGLGLLYVAHLDLRTVLVFVGLGAVAIIAALTYTLGRKPYGYAGLGDLAVWLFFGGLAVTGSYYLHGAALEPVLLLPASACGLLAVAVLNINNMRDLDNDQRCGKFTVPVRLGLKRARHYHLLLLLAAWLQYWLYLLSRGADHPTLWLAGLFLLAAWPLARHALAVRHASTPAQMAPLLPAMVGCAIQVNGLFVLLLVLSTVLRH